jgi:hypothetical protein
MAFLCPKRISQRRGTCIKIPYGRKADLFENHGGGVYTMRDNTVDELKMLIHNAYPNVNYADIIVNNTPDHGMSVHIYNPEDEDDTDRMISFKENGKHALINRRLVENKENLFNALRDFLKGHLPVGGGRRRTRRLRSRRHRKTRRY